jgi:outer membrane protein TolC
MKVKLAITMFALVFSILAKSQESNIKKMNLNEALEFAKTNNATLKNSKLDELLAKKRVKEIVAAGLPQVNGKAEFMHYFTIPTTALPDFISPVVYGNLVGYGVIPATSPAPAAGIVPAQFGVKNNLTVSASASQLLFDGSYLMGLKASNQYVNLAKLGTHQSEIELELNVKKAYYQVLLIDVTMDILNSNIKYLEKTTYDLTETAKAVLMEKMDADRVRLQLSNLNLQRDRLIDGKIIAYTALKLQLGANVGDSIVLTDKINSIQSSNENLGMDLAAGDYSKRIDAQILEQQRKLNNIDKQRWQYSYLPSLAAFGQVQKNTFASEVGDVGKTWYNGALAGITLQMPIFDGLMKQSKIQQAKINDKKIENGKSILNQAIELERISAKSKYLRARQQLKIQKENVDLAKDIMEKSSLKLKEGVGSSLELTSAQNDYLNAESNYLSTLYDILVAEAELKKAIGY